MENLTSPWFLNGDTIYAAMRPDLKLQMIAVEDIGKYVARGFTNADKLNRREIDLAADEATMPDVAMALSQGPGRNISFMQIPIAEVRKNSETSRRCWNGSSASVRRRHSRRSRENSVSRARTGGVGGDSEEVRNADERVQCSRSDAGARRGRRGRVVARTGARRPRYVLEDQAGGDNQLADPADGAHAGRPIWSATDRIAQPAGGRGVGRHAARILGTAERPDGAVGLGQCRLAERAARRSYHLASQRSSRRRGACLDPGHEGAGPGRGCADYAAGAPNETRAVGAPRGVTGKGEREDRPRRRAPAGPRHVQRRAGAPRRSRGAPDPERTSGGRARRAALDSETNGARTCSR